MEYILHTRNLTLSQSDQIQIEKKLNRYQKYLNPPYHIHLHFGHDAHHLKGQVITCKLTIEHGKHTTHAEHEADTIQNSLDQTLEAVEKDLQRQHDRERRSRWNIKRWLGR